MNVKDWTARDEFAAMALPALLAAPDLTDTPDSELAELVASCAYRVADAMLAARSKAEPQPEVKPPEAKPSPLYDWSAAPPEATHAAVEGGDGWLSGYWWVGEPTWDTVDEAWKGWNRHRREAEVVGAFDFDASTGLIPANSLEARP